MKLLRANQGLPNEYASSIATIGNFDGVHKGHQAILAALKEKSLACQLPLVVILFEPQPAEYFNPVPPPRLSSLREKIDLLQQHGVDFVYCISFNKTLASMSPAAFVHRYLFSRLRINYLLVGADFRFGYQRQGDLTLLNKMAIQQGCEVQCLPELQLNNERVSSTRIRHALCSNDFKQAATLLGRPYHLIGRVKKGAGLGRQWGIPTANLSLGRKILPLHGVFCVQVKMPNQTMAQGVANIGSRPTVDGLTKIIEIHLFDVNQSLYGEWLTVFFLCKLRDELKFSSVEALIDQIHKDILAAKRYHSHPSTLCE